MNGIDTILRRLDTGAKAEADAVLKKARQEAADITARYQAQAAQEAARLAARNEKAAEEREERLVSAAQMEGRKTILAAKQTVMEQVYDKALEKLLSLPRTQYIEVLAALLAQASPEGRGEAIFSAADRETAGQAAVDAANAKTGGHLMISAETAPIRGGFLLRQGSVEVNCAFEAMVRAQREQLEKPVFFNCDEDLSDIYESIDYSRGIMFSGRSMVYRETDIISDEKRVNTEYYRRVYRPNNWHYALQMIFGRNKSFLGVVTLYRTIGKEDFTYEDVFLMDMLKDHMAYRLYQERTHQMTNREKLTMTEAVQKYNLTKREQTILGLLLQGMENPEICDPLSITVNTLKKHILNIYRKLGIRNRVQMFKLVKEKE